MIKAFLGRKKEFAPMGGHPWIFKGMIARWDGKPEDGEIIAVFSADQRFIGYGLCNSKSEIAIRLYSWDEKQVCNDEHFSNLIERSIAFRRELKLFDPKTARRLVYSESDGLSGFIVDQYGPYLVCQITSKALSYRQNVLTDALQKLLHPEGIFLKAQPEVAKKEGMEQTDTVLFGNIPEGRIEIEEGDIVFQVALKEGQKTGLYLDQKENHLAVRSWAQGKNVLDLYCYTGGFGLHCAKAGALKVTLVDSSSKAIAQAKENSMKNNLSQIQFVESDVPTYLKEHSDQSFSMVILDPPRFAGSRESKERALRMYYRINVDALKLLAPGGYLVTSSCSGRVSLGEWMEMLTQAGRNSRRRIQVIEVRGASRDHPVSLACPESQYLKCLVGRVV